MSYVKIYSLPKGHIKATQQCAVITQFIRDNLIFVYFLCFVFIPSIMCAKFYHILAFLGCINFVIIHNFPNLENCVSLGLIRCYVHGHIKLDNNLRKILTYSHRLFMVSYYV